MVEVHPMVDVIMLVGICPSIAGCMEPVHMMELGVPTLRKAIRRRLSLITKWGEVHTTANQQGTDGIRRMRRIGN